MSPRCSDLAVTPRPSRTSRPLVELAVCLLAVGVLVACDPSDAFGQQRSRQTIPRSPNRSTFSPAFSPYLGLLRNDGGPLPNYFQFVRPRTQLLDTLRAQDRAIQRERQRIQTVDRRIDSLQQQQRLNQVRPTGVSGGFFRYSHFYPELN